MSIRCQALRNLRGCYVCVAYYTDTSVSVLPLRRQQYQFGSKERSFPASRSGLYVTGSHRLKNCGSFRVSEVQARHQIS
ncbi:hypothetical protein BN126350106 [Stenotrophomonas thermophila]|nr:hypothetical protein BN126350106 [Stenotrophomonas maltophilia]